MPEANFATIHSSPTSRHHRIAPVPVQKPKLLDQSDVKATMIYAHVLNRGGKGVRSPMDSL